MANALGMNNTSFFSKVRPNLGGLSAHVKFVVIAKFSKPIVSCSWLLKSLISLFLQTILKEPNILVALFVATALFFTTSTTAMPLAAAPSPSICWRGCIGTC